MKPAAPILAFLGLASACGDGIPSASDASISDASDGGASGRACAPTLGEPDLALEMIAEGFDRPVHVVAPPGDPRLFVLEQHTGKIRVVSDGAVLDEPFLDLGGKVSRAIEQGLLSLAFHPDYGESGRFFLSYTRGDDALVLEAWQVSSDPDRADPESREELLVVEQPTNFHNGGALGFGPDGYLYIGLGDGGPMYDPEGNTQDLGKLLGKILRLDVDRREGDSAYAVPADNPFVGVEGARPEIWVLGLRNPWSWSFDPATGHLYLGDVGLARWEELDVIPQSSSGGENFGWPVLMGEECVEDECDASGFEPPIYTFSYINQQRCAVVGGHVYRGCSMPGHHGRYFFSDFCAAFVRSFRWSEIDGRSEVIEHDSISGQLERVSAIGKDSNGELLLLDWDGGKLYRIVADL